MGNIEIDQATGPMSAYVDDLGQGEILVVTRGEQPVAALVSLEDIDAESLALSTNPDFLRIIERSRQNFRMCRTLSLVEMRAAAAKMD
jgi:antitoxin (DNA-binding transcriptional repressor) of toxin-antitoxin stability system